jgi:hypothetical protein
MIIIPRFLLFVGRCGTFISADTVVVTIGAASAAATIRLVI